MSNPSARPGTRPGPTFDLPHGEQLQNIKITKESVQFIPPEIQRESSPRWVVDNTSMDLVGSWSKRLDGLYRFQTDFLLQCCVDHRDKLCEYMSISMADLESALYKLDYAIIREKTALSRFESQTDPEKPLHLTTHLTVDTHARLERARRNLVSVIIKTPADLPGLIRLANYAHDQLDSHGPEQNSARDIANLVAIILYHFIRMVRYEYTTLVLDLEVEVPEPRLNGYSWIELERSVRTVKRKFTCDSELWKQGVGPHASVGLQGLDNVAYYSGFFDVLSIADYLRRQERTAASPSVKITVPSPAPCSETWQMTEGDGGQYHHETLPRRASKRNDVSDRKSRVIDTDSNKVRAFRQSDPERHSKASKRRSGEPDRSASQRRSGSGSSQAPKKERKSILSHIFRF